MKKFMQKTLLTASLVCSSVYSNQASAIAGSAMAPVSGPLIASGVCYIVFSELVGAGIGLAGFIAGGAGGGFLGGLLGAPAGEFVEGTALGASAGATTLGATGVVGGTIWSIYHGVVLLEDSNHQDFQFGPLDQRYATENLGLKAEQIKAFNNNVASLNLIKEQVAADMSSKENPDENDSVDAWESVRPDIEALGVSLKTVAHVLSPLIKK